jgi:PAS domain S-box-containing protein
MGRICARRTGVAGTENADEGRIARAASRTPPDGDEARASLLSSIVESSFDAIIGGTAEGMIASWNPAAERIFGYSAEEILGRPVSLLESEERRDEAGGAGELLEAIREGRSVEYGETGWRRKDGGLVYVSLTASPMRDATDRMIGASIVARDVTERRQLEQERQDASRYARSLIEASLDPLVTISPEGKITDVNEATAKVTGEPRERLIGTDFSDYFTDSAKAREGYMKVFSLGFVTDYPLTIRHREGRLTDVLYNASVYKDSKGRVLGVFAAARDITAQKAAEAELVEQRALEERRKRELERLAELERFQKLTVGRELKMIELKKEIEELKARLAALRAGAPEEDA